MKNLTLYIRQIYFDQKLFGEKKSELCAVVPNNIPEQGPENRNRWITETKDSFS